MRTLIMTFLALAALSVQAATTYSLPDPAISVNPNYSNTTTIVTVAGVTYRGPSRFYYVSECVKPDGVRYHCDIMSEAGVVLTAQDGSGRTASVNLTIQSSSTLITSGHNYWRHSDLVLSGSVTL